MARDSIKVGFFVISPLALIFYYGCTVFDAGREGETTRVGLVGEAVDEICRRNCELWSC